MIYRPQQLLSRTYHNHHINYSSELLFSPFFNHMIWINIHIAHARICNHKNSDNRPHALTILYIGIHIHTNVRTNSHMVSQCDSSNGQAINFDVSIRHNNEKE